MDNVIIACVQPRTAIVSSSEEFLTFARRFLHQARAKSAQVAIFPELAGLLLAPPLISGLKLGFIRRADQGRRPKAGLVSRGVGQVTGAMAGMLGGGFRGSLGRLLAKNSGQLEQLYVEAFGGLAQEYGLAIVAGSLYLRDEESGTIRSRAYLFDARGDVIGHQDKLHLNPSESELVSPGRELIALDTAFGRVGLLLGRDALYPELARWLAVQGADLLIGMAACPAEAQARVIRMALGLRAEENQVYVAASFLLGSNYFDPENGEEYLGQSALLSPISASPKADGILGQTGSSRTEGVVAAELDGVRLAALREGSGFRPRQDMHLGAIGAALAAFYERDLTIEKAVSEGFGREPVAAPPARWGEEPDLGTAAEPSGLTPAGMEPAWAGPAGMEPSWLRAEASAVADEDLLAEEEGPGPAMLAESEQAEAGEAWAPGPTVLEPGDELAGTEPVLKPAPNGDEEVA